MNDKLRKLILENPDLPISCKWNTEYHFDDFDYYPCEIVKYTWYSDKYFDDTVVKNKTIANLLKDESNLIKTRLALLKEKQVLNRLKELLDIYVSDFGYISLREFIEVLIQDYKNTECIKEWLDE